MEKEIFKEGDKVYTYRFGWGRVVGVGATLMDVNFNGDIEEFYLDGRFYKDDIYPTLSFTEYTFQGFSQERPIILPEVGEWCLVRDKNSDNWKVKKFIEPVDDGFHVRDVDNQYSHIYEEIKRIKILD